MILHISSGEDLNNKLKKDDEVWVAWNEAMIVGKTSFLPFEKGFIDERCASLDSTKDIYLEKLGPLINIIDKLNDYEKIELNFGEEYFCAINILTVLTLLETKNYKGKIELVSWDEEKHIKLCSKDIILDTFSDSYKAMIAGKYIPSSLTILNPHIEQYISLHIPINE